MTDKEYGNLQERFNKWLDRENNKKYTSARDNRTREDTVFSLKSILKDEYNKSKGEIK